MEISKGDPGYYLAAEEVMGYHSRAGCVVQLDDTRVRAGYTYAAGWNNGDDAQGARQQSSRAVHFAPSVGAYVCNRLHR